MSAWSTRLCSDVRPSSVEWLWRGYVPKGKLSILDGDPEVGKSLVTLDLAARLSRGGPLPDGQTLSRPYVSLLLNGEDGSEDTVRPRAEAAGADLDRLVLAGALNGRVPRFPEDMPVLEDLVVGLGVELVVIDPLMSFLPPGVAANLDQCVRQALTPLADLADRTRCGILLVRHLTKGGSDRAVYRGQGSVGIVAACRTGLLATARRDDPEGRVLSVSKSNAGRRPASLGYRVRGTAEDRPVVEWTGPVQLSADEACRAQPVGLRMRERATDWLRLHLSAGPRPAADLLAAAAAACIPERTLERAKKELPVRSHQHYIRATDQRVWYWYDPAAPWPKDAPFKKPFELEPLPPIGGW
jgi:hypothetical protein